MPWRSIQHYGLAGDDAQLRNKLDRYGIQLPATDRNAWRVYFAILQLEKFTKDRSHFLLGAICAWLFWALGTKNWPFSWLFSIADLLLPRGIDETVASLLGILLLLGAIFYALTEPYENNVEVIPERELNEILEMVTRKK